MAVHNLVIIGASFAGLGTAHYLLNNTIPKLEKANGKSTTYKLTLISPSTHFYYKLASPRLLASPDLIPLSKAFLPLKDGFKEYAPDRFELVVGEATAVDAEKKAVSVTDTYGSSKTTSVPYGTLIIATGATGTSSIWNLKGSHENSVNALKEMHAVLPKANTILIGGGGPAGVETAGELGTLYPKADITILSGGSRLLTRLRPAISAAAESQLKALGVKVVHNDLRVTSATGTTNTTLQLSDKTTRNVDVYIEATGTKPNTSYLPKSWLNERGAVVTADNPTLRGPAPGVYAIGDVAGYSVGSILDIMEGVRPLCSTVYMDLGGPNAKPTSKPFQQNLKETQIVPIGPKGGVGAAFGWRLPSIAVKFFKAKDFMVGKVPGMVQGTDYVKA